MHQTHWFACSDKPRLLRLSLQFHFWIQITQKTRKHNKRHERHVNKDYSLWRVCLILNHSTLTSLSINPTHQPHLFSAAFTQLSLSPAWKQPGFHISLFYPPPLVFLVLRWKLPVCGTHCPKSTPPLLVVVCTSLVFSQSIFYNVMRPLAVTSYLCEWFSIVVGVVVCSVNVT